MSREQIKDLSPFLSLVLIVSTLFTFAFCKMEIRRMGYFTLKLARQERELRDTQRALTIQLARSTRPERLQEVAEHDPKYTGGGQIIEIAGERLVLRQ